MVLDPIPQSLPAHFFGSRPQPPTSLTSTETWLTHLRHDSFTHDSFTNDSFTHDSFTYDSFTHDLFTHDSFTHDSSTHVTHSHATISCETRLIHTWHYSLLRLLARYFRHYNKPCECSHDLHRDMILWLETWLNQLWHDSLVGFLARYFQHHDKNDEHYDRTRHQHCIYMYVHDIHIHIWHT